MTMGGGGEMAARIAAFDWSTTPLGDRATWPQSLRTAVELMLANGFASALLYGPSLTYLYNDALARLIGAHHPSALGVPANEAFPESSAYRLAMQERVWRGETVIAREQPFPIDRAGHTETMWVTISHSPLRDESGAVAGVFVTLLDESAHKRAQMRDVFRVRLADALRTHTNTRDLAAAATRALAEHLGVPRVQYVEVSGREAIVEAEYAVGLPSMIGRHDLDDYGTDVVATYRAGHAIVCDDTHAADLPPEIVARFDSHGVRAHASVPLLKHGVLVAYIGVGSSAPRHWRPDEIALIAETADRTRAAIERAAAVADLRASDRRKDEFLAMLAHELRNPLAPLRAAIGVLRLPDVARETSQELTAIMDRQLEHMVRIVDDLLDVSRITRGKITLHRAPCALDELVKTAIDANRAAIDERRIALSIAIHDRALELDVDATRIVQVLSNVLHNAHKFTPPGGEIRIATRRDGSTLVITVADNGGGIAPEMLPRVFELFAQGSDGSGGGLGIGLALARNLVEMHGGRIEARSAGLGRGTEIEIRLPIAPAAPAAREATAAAAMPASVRVVIIDDNRDAADAAAMLVRTLGAHPVVAYDGERGLARVREVRPDLVLLDIGMPGIDGYETCRRIRAEHGGRVTIVAVTGWGQPADKERTLQAGFDAHLTKPADPAAIRSFLVRHDDR